MSAANISIGDNIEKNYIQDVADADGVSPVAIALGALVFATWGDIEGRIKLRDYTRAGEIRAILAAHVRERLGWAYVLEEDRDPLVRALVSEMIDLDKNQRKLDWGFSRQNCRGRRSHPRQDQDLFAGFGRR